jgi:hypothetical protein
MTSNTTPQLPQNTAHVSTFQSVFEGASQQNASTHASVAHDVRHQAGKDQGAAQSASGSGTDSSASVAAPVNGRSWSAISPEPYVSTVSPSISPNMLALPPSPIETNPYGNTLPIAQTITMVESNASNQVINSNANPITGASGSSHLPNKRDKLRATSARDNTGLLAAPAPAVVDQNSVPVQRVMNEQGSRRDQGDGPSGVSAKTVAANDWKVIHTTPTELVAGISVEEMDAKIIPQLFDANSAAQSPGDSLIVVTEISVASGLQDSVVSGQSIGKAAQKGAPGTISSQKLDLPAPLDIGKSAVSPPLDPVLRSAQGNRPTLQSALVDPAKSAIVAARVPDSSALQPQAQTVAMHVASHDVAASQQVPISIADPAGAAKTPEVPATIHTVDVEPVASSGINAAKLIQSMSGSEMRVGMHSAEFGDISIRTTVSQQQMVTQISLSHSDLSQEISAHVATVQARLGEDYGLHASIEINNQASSLAGDPGKSSQQEQRSFYGSTKASGVAMSAISDSAISVGAIATVGSQYGLDIRI